MRGAFHLSRPISAARHGARRQLGLVAKNGAYVFRIDGDVTRVSNANPHHTKLKNMHIEGCCFVPEGLLVASERRMIFLFTYPAFRRQ